MMNHKPQNELERLIAADRDAARTALACTLLAVVLVLAILAAIRSGDAVLPEVAAVGLGTPCLILFAMSIQYFARAHGYLRYLNSLGVEGLVELAKTASQDDDYEDGADDDSQDNEPEPDPSQPRPGVFLLSESGIEHWQKFKQFVNEALRENKLSQPYWINPSRLDRSRYEDYLTKLIRAGVVAMPVKAKTSPYFVERDLETIWNKVEFLEGWKIRESLLESIKTRDYLKQLA